MPNLTLQVLQDNNTPRESFDFYPGEDVEMRLQVLESETEHQFPIPSLGRDVALILPANPTNQEILNAAMTVDSRNQSVVSTILSDAVTATLTSGNIRLVMSWSAVGDAPDLSLFTVAENAKLTVGGVDFAFTQDGTSAGTFQINDAAGLALDALGVVVSDTQLAATNVVVQSVSGNGPATIGVALTTDITRMAQLRNAMKRLTPNPIT